MSWLLHTRRVPIRPSSRQPLGGSAAQPASPQYTCAGVGDPDEVAWICYDCATCLCVDDALIKMPEYSLANLLWIGREHPLLQQFGTLGLRMLICLGRPCFRKLLLGKGHKEDRQSGLTGNHILVSQPAAELGDVLPPTSTQLSTSFVAIFGQSIEDLQKCQLLIVNRDAYATLLQERALVNATYANARVDQPAVSSMPIDGVPAQILECACAIPESDRYKSTRMGPGSIRDPLDLAAEKDDASDELSDADNIEEGGSDAGETAETATPDHANQFETPLGLDPTASPSYVQHFAAFQTQVNLVKDAFRAKVRLDSRTTQLLTGSTEQSAKPEETIGAATAAAAAEEECHRAIIDLRRAAQVLGNHSFEEKAKVLEGADKGLFVPSIKPLSMFEPPTWTS